ncbi:hypothetical protein [Jiangella asiatica]|nr:hypothetical protein [Jiangella asiatica]
MRIALVSEHARPRGQGSDVHVLAPGVDAADDGERARSALPTEVP